MTTVLVTGGTGTLGRRIVAHRPDVRVLSRRAGNGAVVGDLVKGTGIDEALAGVDVVLHCASGQARGADPAGTRTLIEACRKSDRRPTLIYVSIVGIDRVPMPYYADKLESERLLEASALPWTILRATQFHDLMVRILSAVKGPIVPAPIGLKFQPVDADEVAQRLVELADQPAQGRVDDLGGPEVRGLPDLARAFVRGTGRHKLVLPVPLPGKLAAALRAGGLTTPEHAVGRVTFEEFLARGRARTT